MIKLLHNDVWVFDCEWVPDPVTGRAVYGLPAEMSDEAVIQEMWVKAGADEENPRPFLKTVLCAVISVAAVRRSLDATGKVNLKISSLPRPAAQDMKEREILDLFLTALGDASPQIVGFNSQSADLKILVQRALVHGLSLPAFCKRPAKPWEGRDYFARGSDWHIDLLEEIGGWGKATPSLHELAVACGIPGKLDYSGDTVIDLWLSCRKREIVQYNECDALTTYLIWLRTAHLSGLMSSEQYSSEQLQFEVHLKEQSELAGNEHLKRYLDAWVGLRRTGQGSSG
jgi:3'-5' exonuclease